MIKYKLPLKIRLAMSVNLFWIVILTCYPCSNSTAWMTNLAFMSVSSELDPSWTLHWSNLIGYWKFNGIPGSIATGTSLAAKIGSPAISVNSSGTGLNLVAGKLSQGIGFDGVAYAHVPSASAPNPNALMTLAFWVNSSSTLQWGKVISKNINSGGVGWEIQRYGGTGTLGLRIDTSANYNQGVYMNGSVLDGTWHFLAITINNGFVQWYVDGQPSGSGSFNTGTGIGGTSDLYFGVGSDSQFAGSLDEVSIWNIALDSASILQIYKKQSQARR